MNEQALIRGTEAPTSAVGSVELMGKVWVANERNSKAGAIPDAVSDREQQIILEDRIIEMAWEDRTPFEAIRFQFGLSEAEVIALMRKELKRSSFERWRKRVNTGVSQKHLLKRDPEISRFKCDRQRTITHNKISKR